MTVLQNLSVYQNKANDECDTVIEECFMESTKGEEMYRMLLFSMILHGCEDGKGSTTIDLCEDNECDDPAIEDSGITDNTQVDSGIEDPVQEDTQTETEPDNIDNDGDGYSEEDGDCNDNDPNISPVGNDNDVDGIDQNCDSVDGIDADGDGSASIESGGDDCDDTRSDVSPTISESCDTIDNDCDGILNNGRECLVYAHSSSTLYKVDPFQMTITEITSVPSLFDFDTDMSGTIYGISPPNSIYVFDEIAVSWNQIATLNHNNGTLNGFCIDSANKTYATVGNAIFDIDTTTGDVQLIGNLGGNFTSSGDCVIDKTDGIYMTSNAWPGDDLVQIDPITGAGTLIGNTGVPGIYGLTSAWGYMFGFTGNGSLVQIDKTTGQSEVLHVFPNIMFYGAASSAMR